MHWFDVGVNVPSDDSTLAPMLMRATDANVQQIMLTGTDLAISQQAAQLASLFPKQVYSTAGIHPHYAQHAPTDFAQQIKMLAEQPQVVAIGECGLDFNRDFSPRDMQLAVFEQQLIIACELKMPVFLHERDAFDAQYALLQKYHQKLAGALVHCFTGNTEQMQAYLALGCYIGVTGWVTDEKRGTELREAMAQLPLEHLILETDAPYLKPKNLGPDKVKGVKQNEPCYIPVIAKTLASLMDTSVETIAEHSLRNTHQLLALG
ncbi:TatD family hydrolase [Paraglaciecola polaris]|jgi:TatD DNase family protein|uniref:TatD DNase family protein n=1 Tax=Paraglaciecola polaris LMG 21857 TaxID=1129793 RepID=K6YJQ8_9ALTE|nr:TatD family hydrolase [Paraglaciecola polaris]GAC32959.1 TatD DNase family protein [Paraglaciecola polaris LMG 21857]|tara:strand:+ start:997 stop:1785 length:789 start_codon:yes stop_codon:yes gene_type:complete